jgi:hypothetical protein
MTWHTGKKKRVDETIFEVFGSQVQSGQYRYWTAASLLPAGIPWGGDDCDCVLLAASMTGGSPMYVWQMFRAYCGNPPRHKLDENRYFPDGSGGLFSQHVKPKDRHYNFNVSTSGFSGLQQDNHIPSASFGLIEDARSGGMHISF